MLKHLFVLIVSLNGDVQSEDMYFYDIYQCNKFAAAVVQSKNEKTALHDARRTTITSYCIPRLLDPRTVKAY